MPSLGGNAGTAYVDVRPALANFGAALERGLAPVLQRVGKRMESVGKTLTKGVTLPIVGLGIAAVKAFGEAEQVTAKTEAVIKSTGGAANVTKDHVLKLAGAIRDYSGVEDEAIQNGENLLLTFKGIQNQAGKGNDIFDQATKTMVDMSVALGTDASGSAIQLGKALNDPIKGVTALTRVGVSFTESQKEQIKALVESGDKLGAQKIILAELKDEFGGAARAVGGTGTGSMKIALSQAGDALEALGAIVVPVISKVATFAKDLADKFQALSPHQKEFVVKLLAIAAAAGPVLFIFGKLFTVLSRITQITGAVVGFFAKATAAATANATATAAASGQMQLFGTTAAGGAGSTGLLARGLTLLTNPVGAAVAAVGLLTAGIIDAINQEKQFQASTDALGAAMARGKFSAGELDAAMRAQADAVDNAALRAKGHEVATRALEVTQTKARGEVNLYAEAIREAGVKLSRSQQFTLDHAIASGDLKTALKLLERAYEDQIGAILDYSDSIDHAAEKTADLEQKTNALKDSMKGSPYGHHFTVTAAAIRTYTADLERAAVAAGAFRLPAPSAPQAGPATRQAVPAAAAASGGSAGVSIGQIVFHRDSPTSVVDDIRWAIRTAGR